MPVDALRAGVERMRRAGADSDAVAGFERSYARLEAGERGWIAEHELEPLDSIPDIDAALDEAGELHALRGVAVVRLNGGLGTTMATQGGKGSLAVKPGVSFVDLAVGHVAALRSRTGCELPLLFMNSPVTAASTTDLARSFEQCMLPRLRVEDLHPVDWPRDPALEWAPAGHGDVFRALARSGHLRALLDAGFERACISSVDNVAAGIDARVAAVMQRESIPFLMEVADRTDVDRKGGHLARRRGGGLILRDRAQTPPAESAAFHDIDRHRFFNTNTIWVDLRALDERLAGPGGGLELPLIANHKRVDQYDDTSPEVIQLETAMGAGISAFDGAEARRVPRSRFNPVKSTAELLAVRSDAYALTADHRLALVPQRAGRAPVIELDPERFARQRDFDRRFPSGPPSLRECVRLVVRGDVTFGSDVVVRGSVCIDHRGPGLHHIESGSVLHGDDVA